MKTHQCDACGQTKHSPELNDDPAVNPKFKLDELVRIEYHGSPMYRIMEIKGQSLLLEKV